MTTAKSATETAGTGGKGAKPETIRASGVTKMYGEFAAVQDVSFSVSEGTVAAFLGPNGAGKSTTMKILTGYLAPTRGSVSLVGLNPGDPAQRIVLARRLGYLPENGPLYRDMTPRELLQFMGTVRGVEGLNRAIDRVVSECAIDSVMAKPIAKLSKGFRQRVGMAQALLHDPEVLILDEPTSGLDPLQIRQVRQLIRKLGETKTILLSTHILQEVEAVADEVVVINEGRIAYTGGLKGLIEGSTIEQKFYDLCGGKSKNKNTKEVA